MLVAVEQKEKSVVTNLQKMPENSARVNTMIFSLT